MFIISQVKYLYTHESIIIKTELIIFIPADKVYLL